MISFDFFVQAFAVGSAAWLAAEFVKYSIKRSNTSHVEPVETETTEYDPVYCEPITKEEYGYGMSVDRMYEAFAHYQPTHTIEPVKQGLDDPRILSAVRAHLESVTDRKLIELAKQHKAVKGCNKWSFNRKLSQNVRKQIIDFVIAKVATDFQNVAKTKHPPMPTLKAVARPLPAAA